MAGMGTPPAVVRAIRGPDGGDVAAGDDEPGDGAEDDHGEQERVFDNLLALFAGGAGCRYLFEDMGLEGKPEEARTCPDDRRGSGAAAGIGVIAGVAGGAGVAAGAEAGVAAGPGGGGAAGGGEDLIAAGPDVGEVAAGGEEEGGGGDEEEGEEEGVFDEVLAEVLAEKGRVSHTAWGDGTSRF